MYMYIYIYMYICIYIYVYMYIHHDISILVLYPPYLHLWFSPMDVEQIHWGSPSAWSAAWTTCTTSSRRRPWEWHWMQAGAFEILEVEVPKILSWKAELWKWQSKSHAQTHVQHTHTDAISFHAHTHTLYMWICPRTHAYKRCKMVKTYIGSLKAQASSKRGGRGGVAPHQLSHGPS